MSLTLGHTTQIQPITLKVKINQLPKPPEVKKLVKTHEKPAFSYTQLVTLALNSSPNGLLRVLDIYKFIGKHFPYYNIGKGTLFIPSHWLKNVIRFYLGSLCVL